MSDDPKRYYPVFLDLENRLAVVVGGGPGAERKAKQLQRHGADVTVITTDPTEALLWAEASGELTLERRGYVRGDLAGAFIAICVATDPEVRRAVYAEAESVGCLVNTVDAPEMCSFIVPSVVNREPLQIAVSTGGLAPGLAKQVRRFLSAEFGPEWGEYARLLGEVRGIACETLESNEERATVLEAVVGSKLLDRLRAGEHPTAARLFEEASVSSADEGEA